MPAKDSEEFHSSATTGQGIRLLLQKRNYLKKDNKMLEGKCSQRKNKENKKINFCLFSSCFHIQLSTVNKGIYGLFLMVPPQKPAAPCSQWRIMDTLASGET